MVARNLLKSKLTKIGDYEVYLDTDNINCISRDKHLTGGYLKHQVTINFYSCNEKTIDFSTEEEAKKFLQILLNS